MSPVTDAGRGHVFSATFDHRGGGKGEGKDPKFSEDGGGEQPGPDFADGELIFMKPKLPQP